MDYWAKALGKGDEQYLQLLLECISHSIAVGLVDLLWRLPRKSKESTSSYISVAYSIDKTSTADLATSCIRFLRLALFSREFLESHVRV